MLIVRLSNRPLWFPLNLHVTVHPTRHIQRKDQIPRLRLYSNMGTVSIDFTRALPPRPRPRSHLRLLRGRGPSRRSLLSLGMRSWRIDPWARNVSSRPLTYLFQAVVQRTFRPQCCKQARAKTLAQPRKDDYTLIETCRPIVLLNAILLRTYETSSAKLIPQRAM